MKSMVLKNFKNSLSEETFMFNNQEIELESNLEICIYSLCTLKSIKGYDFCYKHFKNFDERNDNIRLNRANLLPDTIQKEEKDFKQITAKNTDLKIFNNQEKFDNNVLSEQKFLYKDLMRKSIELNENYESSDSSNHGEELLVGTNNLLTGKRRKRDHDHYLRNATVYSKEEVIKVFKSKIAKLDLLYKHQLSMINDKLFIDRKQFLTMKSNVIQSSPENEDSNTESAVQLKNFKKYRPRSNLRIYLNKKYRKSYMQDKSPYSKDSNSTCRFNQKVKGSSLVELNCYKRALPLSNFCKKHILSDPNQVLFYKCPDIRCSKPLIESIQMNCPIHISNKFIDSNADISEELLKSDSESSLNSDNVDDYPDTANSEIDKLSESENQNHSIKLLMSNIKLISIIKEEKFENDYNKSSETDLNS